MASISDKAKKVLESNLGSSYEELCGMDVKEEISFVRAKTGKSPKFLSTSKEISRGNPLLARGRFTTMEDINSRIDALHK